MEIIAARLRNHKTDKCEWKFKCDSVCDALEVAWLDDSIIVNRLLMAFAVGHSWKLELRFAQREWKLFHAVNYRTFCRFTHCKEQREEIFQRARLRHKSVVRVNTWSRRLNFYRLILCVVSSKKAVKVNACMRVDSIGCKNSGTGLATFSSIYVNFWRF